MPTREFKRWWCPTCNEWTLFYKGWGKEDEYTCQVCNSIEQSFKLVDVAEDKIMEQRVRWTQSQKNDIGRLFGAYIGAGYANSNPLINMFKEPGYDDQIIEHPAGQDVIDEKIRAKKRAEMMKRHEEWLAAQAEKRKYQHLGRNELCLCGSGLKYKKCCWARIQQIR